MSLFKQLLELHQGPVPLEDFFTELIAYFLQQHPEALRQWLESLRVPIVFPFKEISVSAQTELLDEANNRVVCPDILVSVCSDNTRSMIMIESKIAARERPGQLREYAEVLASYQGLSGRALLYVTRDDDPKNATHIPEGLRESGIGFYQGRWHEFYRILGSFADS